MEGFHKHSPPKFFTFFWPCETILLDHRMNLSNFRSDQICMLSCTARWRSRLKTDHSSRKILRVNITSGSPFIVMSACICRHALSYAMGRSYNGKTHHYKNLLPARGRQRLSKASESFSVWKSDAALFLNFLSILQGSHTQVASHSSPCMIYGHLI